MKTIEVFYLIATLISLGACIPQIKQLIQTRRADEFNMTSWTTWFFTQIISLTYAISVGETMLILANIAWVSFYLTMVCLIFYYRRQAVPESITVHSTEE